jgi:SAM-dependent methyltransferase
MSSRFSIDDNGASAPLEQHVSQVASLYGELSAYGPYGTLAPGNRGGRKSQYVSDVFDAALLPILERQAGRSDRLLDYGCGTGIFSVKAAQLVCEVTGLDVSQSMLDWGKKIEKELGLEGMRWILGDGRSIPLADASVDWVVARESLCYVPLDALPGLLEEIRRVLSPGGRFLWLEQVSDNPAFFRHDAAPLLEKRPSGTLIELGRRAGMLLEKAYCVRQPRFPWIYLIWAGLLPRSFSPRLARWEVAINRRYSPLSAKRWKDALMILRKPR